MRDRLRLICGSFGARLTAAFTGVGLAAAALTAILVNLSFNALLSGYLSGQQQERQQMVAGVLATSYEREGGWRPAALDQLGAELLPDGGDVRVRDTSGVEVWTYSTSTSAGAIHRELMGEGALSSERSMPILDRGVRVGTALMRLPTPGLLPHDREFQTAVNRMLLVGGLVGGLLALGLALLLARRATQPVRELTSAATELASGRAGRRIHITADREFGAMADAFNAMADTIEAQEEVRRAYASEVAHELRTPLMIQRSQFEAMEDGLIEPDPASFRSLLEENRRLSRLVADLEVLGSAEAARFSLQRRPLDLAEPVRTAAAQVGPLFREKGIELSVDLRPVAAQADSERVGQVVVNLLSNAVKHTRRGGRVSISLRRSGPWGIIEVSDSGRGISEADLPKVFERFYRGHQPQGRGAGIGLAVVRELTEAHGGRATVESLVGRGATFRIVLPADTTPSSAGGELEPAGVPA
jgi:signal transduction histidine kinase